MVKKKLVKKIMVKKVDEKCKCQGRSLWLLAFIVFGAFGFAAIIQGILGQISQGFSYGFFAYLLGFIFIALAKFCKRKICSC
ncbi:MAG: hypothetical protein KKF52_03530 [Nanoarchaeota archaeon]|nr:hypothetical protein [Nanoarchaeota archaeon]MBU4242277.1 hypothetical protein [Nanoarchaeota archaeon]MBU4352608.1 hypothetical protein [Nanoarchaeota archaeon]